MNRLLHQQRTEGGEAGVVGEHPVKEEKKIIIAARKDQTMEYNFPILLVLYATKRQRSSNMSPKQQTLCRGSWKTSLFMSNKGGKE